MYFNAKEHKVLLYKTEKKFLGIQKCLLRWLFVFLFTFVLKFELKFSS